MSETILVALITGGLALIGVIITNASANAKMTQQIEKAQAITDTKLDALTREVREHNNFAKRVPVLEERMNAADRRLGTLERQTKA